MLTRLRRVVGATGSWLAARARSPLGRGLRLALAGAAVLGLLWVALWRLPQWQVDQANVTGKARRATLENEYRRTAVQAVGGFVVLVGLWFAWRRIRASERAVLATEEGQITERFGRAIEHLGDERMAVRLGGIYALERIARDSAKDHPACLDVLCAFLRSPPGPLELASVTEDSRAALTVIGRRNQGQDAYGQVVDLREALLDDAFLDDAHLELANLFKARLVGAKLARANLVGANLREAHLERAYLARANLEGANLREAHLERAYLVANLEGANLREAHLERANLGSANLVGANLHEAHLEGANLVGANLDGANLREAHLEGANLEGAHLGGGSALAGSS